MDKTLQLILAARQGDSCARKKIVEENTALVWSVARRFTKRGYDLEELYQIGCIGLIKCVDKFDPSFEVKFSTYAVPMIMGEIKRFLRDNGMIKVSRGLKETGYKVVQQAQKLEGDYGRHVTVEEVAASLELPVEEVVLAMEANQSVESIYEPIYQENHESICLIEKLRDQTNEQKEVENQIFLEQMLQLLNEREKEIILLRYFNDCTQSQIGEKLGISQVQISRIEKRALQKMREGATKYPCSSKEGSI